MVLPRAYGRTVQEEEAAEQESSPRSSFTSSQRTLLTRKQETLVPSTPVGLAWHSSLLCAALDSRRAGETCLALFSYAEWVPAGDLEALLGFRKFAGSYCSWANFAFCAHFLSAASSAAFCDVHRRVYLVSI